MNKVRISLKIFSTNRPDENPHKKHTRKYCKINYFHLKIACHRERATDSELQSGDLLGREFSGVGVVRLFTNKLTENKIITA